MINHFKLQHNVLNTSLAIYTKRSRAFSLSAALVCGRGKKALESSFLPPCMFNWNSSIDRQVVTLFSVWRLRESVRSRLGTFTTNIKTRTTSGCRYSTLLNASSLYHFKALIWSAVSRYVHRSRLYDWKCSSEGTRIVRNDSELAPFNFVKVVIIIILLPNIFRTTFALRHLH